MDSSDEEYFASPRVINAIINTKEFGKHPITLERNEFERHGLQDPRKVEDIQMKIIENLRDYIILNRNYQQGTCYFSRLLGILPELRSLSMQGLQRIFYLKIEDLVPIPTAIDKMFIARLPF